MDKTEHPLLRWRRKKHLSVRALAEMLTGESGEPLVSAASLVRIENGHQRVSNAVMVKLFELSDGELRPDHFVLPEHLAARADSEAADDVIRPPQLSAPA